MGLARTKPSHISRAFVVLKSELTIGSAASILVVTHPKWHGERITGASRMVRNSRQLFHLLLLSPLAVNGAVTGSGGHNV
jgi:hypothetical protein